MNKKIHFLGLGFTKIYRDLWLNRSRSIMVILSITLSVMAFGVLNTTRAVLLDNYLSAYIQSEPAQALLILPDFDQTLVDKVSKLSEIRLVEGRRQFHLNLEAQGGIYQVVANAAQDPDHVQINRLSWAGNQPVEPGVGKVLVDRSFQTLLALTPGQELSVKTAEGQKYTIQVAGVPNDLSNTPAQFSLIGQIFMSLDTAVELGQSRSFNQLLVITNADSDDPAVKETEVRRQVTRVIQMLEQDGYPVLMLQLPPVGEPPLFPVFSTLLLILQIFGFLIVLLSLLVVSNVTAALIAEQTLQVGILKALGSRALRVMAIYSQMILIIGSIALLISLPLVIGLSQVAVNLLGGLMDAEIRVFLIPLSTWVSLPLLAYGVPLAAVIAPLWRAARISIRQAISNETSPTIAGQAVLRSGPLLLRSALRNLLQKKQRLFLNLIMLGLAGTMFIAALNVRSEMMATIISLQQKKKFDISIILAQPVDRQALEQAALQVEGVHETQGFLSGWVGRILADDTLFGSARVMAVPVDTDFHPLPLIRGEWPAGERGIALSAEALEQWDLKTGLEVPAGQALTVTSAGRRAEWVLAGAMGRTTFPWLYVPYDAYADLTGLKGQANYLAARLAPGADGQAVMKQLVHAMEQAGYKMESAVAEADQSAAERSTIDVVMICLLAIVALTALVGGIGLSSTLSISVMERRREIGILRSMGARPALIRRLVLTEGLLIGLFSLVLSWPLAWLFTLILGKALVESAFGIVPTLVYLPEAAFAWAGLVCILALLSSWLPARQAGKLSIREILIYLG